MFTDKTKQIIQSLVFDPNAKTVASLLPLGSIFWTDELPSMRFPAFGEDMNLIMRLFAIRINFWESGKIADEAKPLWQVAQQTFPDWAFFRRLQLTAQHRQEHEDAQRQMENLFEELNTLGDDFVYSEGSDGFGSFSVTIKVADE
jgi:hypothetical protein